MISQLKMIPAKTSVICAILVIFIASTKAETQSNPNLTSSHKNEKHPDSTLTEIQCHTAARLHNITFVWNIDCFDFQRPEDNEKNFIESPTFFPATYEKSKWYLRLYTGTSNSDNISLFLNHILDSCEAKTRAKFAFSFLDSEENVLKTYVSKLKIFSKSRPESGCNKIPLKEVISPDNTLNILCKIAICECNTDIFNSTVQTHNPVGNLGNSDVVLVLSKNGKEYPSQKAILSARSPVFAAMFKDALEKGEKIERINITDVDEPVFDELFKYIYTNKLENIETLVRGLLAAARKYELDDLKTTCVEQMSKKLTVENAVDTLILAVEHECDKLKSKAIQILAVNYLQVSNTPEWKLFVETYPKLALEVMSKYY